MLKAVTRQAASVDAKLRALNADPTTRHPLSTAYFFDHHATAEDTAVTVTERDFLDAHRELIPSVGSGELAHYEKVRAAFEGTGKTQTRQPSGTVPGARPASASSAGSRGSFRGKGKLVLGAGRNKGKGLALHSDEEHDGEEEGVVNGRARKGKGVADVQGDGGDDDLY